MGYEEEREEQEYRDEVWRMRDPSLGPPPIELNNIEREELRILLKKERDWQDHVKDESKSFIPCTCIRHSLERDLNNE